MTATVEGMRTSLPSRPKTLVLTDTPQVVLSRRAAGFVRPAAYVAVYVTTSPGGAADVLDTTKRCVLRLLRNREHVWLSELFGTVVIGRPEPISRPSSET